MSRVKENKLVHFDTVKTKDVNGKVTKEETTEKYLVPQEPDYIKLYINTLLTFKDLPKQMNPLLIELLKHMTYADPEADHGGQLIILNAFAKESIAKRLKLKMNTIDHGLTKFVKCGILKRIGTGTYQANPDMFGRGEWKDIKAIRATFDFNAGTVIADINGSDQLKLPIDEPQSFLKRAAAGLIANDEDDEEENVA